MHGSVIQKFRKFVNSLSEDLTAWLDLKGQVGLSGRIYLPTETYPDSELQQLIKGASRKFRIPREKLLEAFGEFLVPDLLKVYGYMLKPEWKALDLIVSAEANIPQIIQLLDENAELPKITAEKINDSQVKITYHSIQKMSSLGVGLIKGIGNHYGEKLDISQTFPNNNKEKCEIFVRKIR